MSVPDVDEGLVGDGPNSGVEIDGVGVGSGVGELLCGCGGTLTKVVLPVPDMPMAMMQVLFPSMRMKLIL